MWFSSLDLNNAILAYQLAKPPEPINFQRDSMGWEMPNKIYVLMDSLLKDVLFINCYIDDNLFSSKGSLEEIKAILWKLLNILEIKNMAVEWEKCAFFLKDIEWLGFKISKSFNTSRIKIFFCFNKPVHEIRTGNQD